MNPFTHGFTHQGESYVLDLYGKRILVTQATAYFPAEVKAEEDAHFVGYLCSDAASCFVGQVIPISG